MLRKTGLIAATLALALGCAETWARRRHHNIWPPRDPHPYVMFTRPLDERQPLPPKPRGEYRIVMLGGSTVAYGRPSLPILLEELCATSGLANVKVYNAGVVSYKSGQELAQLLFEVLDAKPDLVILYDGGNDIMDPYYLDPRPGYPMDFLVYENNPLLRSAETFPMLSLFAYRSALLRHLFPDFLRERLLRLARLKERVGYGSDAWRGEIADTYVGNLLKIRTVARAFGVKTAFFFQPLLYFKTSLGPNEKNLLLPDIQRHALETRRLIRERLARERKAGLQVRDLSDVFIGIEEDAFVDYIHTHQKYKVLVAEKIFRSLDLPRR